MADGPRVPTITLPGVSFGNTVPAAPAPVAVPVVPSAAALEFLNSPAQMEAAAAARQNGNTEFTAGMIDELRTLSQPEVAAKYGPEVAARRHEIVAAEQAFQTDLNSERDMGQIVGDTALGVASSGVGMLYGAAGLLNGAFSPEAGVQAVEDGAKAQEWIRSFQSQELTERREATALMRSLDYAESAAQLEDERADGSGEFMSGLRRIGRDSLTYAASIAEDPALAVDLTAEAIGSLLPSTGAIKVANAAARGTRLAAAAGPAVIGGMEAGGAHSQAVQAVLAMSEEQLMAGSEDYRALRENPEMTHEAAQAIIANSTGMDSAATQFPLAMAAGIGVARFEAAPLRAGSVPEIARNVVSETAEEAFQGGTGQLSSNLAVQQNADVNQGLSAGVGEAVAAGALGGLGMAGTLQTPALAAETTRAATQGAVAASRARIAQVNEAIRKTGGATVEIARQGLDALDALRAPLEAAATSLPEPVAGVVPPASVAGPSAVEGTAPVTEDTVGEMLDQTGPETPAPLTPAPEQVAASRILEQIAIPQTEIDSIPETIKPIVMALNEDGSTNNSRGKMLLQAAVGLMQNPDMPADQKRSTALFAYDQVAKLQSFILEDTPAEVAGLAEDHPTRLAYDEAKMTLEAVTSIPEIKAAMEAALVAEMEPTEISEVSPEGATNTIPIEPSKVQEAVQVSTANPVGVDVGTVDRILNQDTNLTPEKIASLKAARATKIVADTVAKAKDGLAQNLAKVTGKKPRPTMDIVKKQIHLEGKTTKDPNRILPSLNDFARYISTSMSLQGNYIPDAKGNPTNAQESYDRLGDFAQHMINKIGAFNKSAQLNMDGKSIADVQVKYDTLTADGWVKASSALARPVGVTVKSPQSRAMVKEAYLDAMASVELYNQMVDIYGDKLGGKKLTLPALDQLIGGVDFKLPEVLIADLQSGSPSDPNRQEPRKLGIKDLDLENQEAEIENQTLVDEEAPTPAEDVDRAPTAEEKKIADAEAAADALADIKKVNTKVTGEVGVTRSAEPTAEEIAEAEAQLEAEEAAAAAKPKERKLRKDAVLKKKESLVDRSDEEGDQSPAPLAEVVEEKVQTNLLPNKDGISRFARAFRATPGTSLLAGLKNPLQVMIATLKNQNRIKVFSKNRIEYMVPMDQLKVLQETMAVDVPAIIEKLNARLETVEFSKGSKGIMEAYRAGRWVTDFMEGKAAALIDPETGKYDSRLAEIGVIAGIHWALNAQKNKPMDEEEIAKSFGWTLETYQNNPDLQKLAAFGMDDTQAKEGLARTIQEFMGIQAIETVTMSDTRGIIEGFASEILKAMDGSYVEIENLPSVIEQWVEDENGVGKMELLNVEKTAVKTDTENTKEELSKLGGLKGLLGDMILAEDSNKHRYVGEPPKSKVKATQRKNRFSKLSNTEQSVLTNLRKIEFYRNTPFLDFLNAMGQESTGQLFGDVNIDPDLRLFNDEKRDAEHRKKGKVNRKHRKTIEGKNLSNKMSWEGVMDHDAAIRSYAEANGMAPEDVPTYYDWYITKVGRHGMEGFGPQADKLAREAFISTVSVLDLTKPEHMEFFWMTVAQSSGISKTEKDTRSKAISDTHEKLIQKYPESLRILTEWHAAKQTDPEAQITLDQQNTIIAETGGAASAKLMHSLLAVAQLDYALSVGGPAMENFVHMLSLEADGKTDGPINAMMHFTSGRFEKHQLELLAKGGFFVNDAGATGEGKTLNEHYLTDKVDLYQAGATKMAQLMRDLKKTLVKFKSGSNNPAEFLTSLERFSSVFGDVSFDDKGDIVIGRNTMKNPLTVTTYGSGINGITGKVANSLLDSFYEQLSGVIQGDQDNKIMNYPGGEKTLQADLNLLFNGVAVYSKKKSRWFAIYDNSMDSTDLSDPWDFEFSMDQRANFLTNVRNLMVTPMDEAIQSLMGETTKATKRFQLATQIQAAVMMDKFTTRIEEELKKKRDAGDKDYLSQAEYDAIFKELEIYGAIVENNVQTLNMGTKEKSQSDKRLSSALDRTMAGTSTLPGPSAAGVRAAPYLTIARGDAMMINNIYAAEDAILRSLPVFDGVELAADIIDSASQRINKAVADAWLEQNPAMDVAESYAAFLREKPFEKLSEAAKADIADMIARYQSAQAGKKVLPDVSKLDSNSQSIHKALLDQADSIQLRKDTLKEVLYSVDHMASAESPYLYRGQALRTDIPLHQALNEIYDAKQAERAAQDKQAVERPSAVLTKAISQAGRGLGDGVVSLTTKGLKSVLSRFNGMSPDQRRVADLVRKNLHGDLTFLFGSSDSLTQYRNQKFQDRQGEPAVGLGQIDLRNKVVYVSNQSVETTLHEAVHAITMQKIFDFYLAPGKLKPEEAAAVERLELLMNDFMGRDFLVATDAATSEAALKLQDTITTLMSEGLEDSKAAAVSEFVSWSLSNENLIRLNKATRNKNPLAQISQAVLKALGKLFGRPDGDVFSHILFNAKVLSTMDRETTGSDVTATRILHHGNPRADTRLQEMYDNLESKILSFLNSKQGQEADAILRDVTVARGLGLQSTDMFKANGYDNWTEQQRSLFGSVQAVMATQMEIEPITLARTQKLYRHVLSKLTYTDLMENPDSQDVAEITRGQARFRVLTGGEGSLRDAQGNTNLLSSFLALVQVDETFRKALTKIDVPKAIDVNWKGSMNEKLESFGRSMIDGLSITLTREGRYNSNIQEALDKLTASLAQIEKDNSTYLEVQANSLLDHGDGLGTRMLEAAGDWLGATADARRGEARSRTAKAIYGGAGLLSGFLNENRGKASIRTITGWMNQTDHLLPIREMASDVIGMTDENKAVLALVGKVKYAVSAMRQDYREKLPQIFESKFKTLLKDEQRKAMHTVMGKADIAALRDSMSVNQVVELLRDDAKLKAEIQSTEAALKAMNSYNFPTFVRKSKQLAKFMVTGVAGQNLLTNAYAISQLLNEPNQKVRGSMGLQGEALIDKLTSLYALLEVDDYQRFLVADLATNETDGVAFMTEYLSALRIEENKKATTEVARLNGLKGYIPNEVKEGVRLVVARDADHASMVEMGFVRKGSHTGPLGVGRTGQSYSYYYSAVAGRSTFSQGVMQTVQTLANGVDPLNGKVTTGITAGAVHGGSVKYFNDRIQKKTSFTERENREAFLPRFDENGKLSYFERMMDPAQLDMLARSDDLGEMMGAWHGRITEERLATEFNSILVDRLKDVWESAQREGQQDEFINLAEEQEDPILNDIWNVVPFAMKEQIESAFGSNTFMVRRDMLLNSLGSRNASVADAFTGETRLPEEAQKAIINVTKSLFGKDAFKFSVMGERAIQTAVSSAKDIIVIRSVIVPAMNFVSNELQLISAGVPWRKSIMGKRAKLIEIDTHLKNLSRRIEIKAELQAAQDDTLKAKLRAEFKSIEDSDRKMSIYPLIQEGMFSTISEGMTELDESLVNGRFQDWVESQVNKLPDGVKTAGKYALITRDTALYQGMSRAVQYGDFLAKSTLYDHLVSQGMEKQEAIDTVREEFIEYNFLAGRTRSYAESMGLIWFWNFKIRSIKIALRMAKRNPARVLLMGFGGIVLPDLGIGSPIKDNFVSLWWEGKLGYSMGPGMMFNAPQLHPWMNLFR